MKVRNSGMRMDLAEEKGKWNTGNLWLEGLTDRGGGLE